MIRMPKYRNPDIPKGSKVIIGLGDSFTEGVGSWSKSTYNKYDGFIDPLNVPKEIYDEMYYNSWPCQLSRNHLPDYIPINLGITGKGNRAAVKELYLNPALKLENASGGIMVLMLSGIERFDFINKEYLDHHFYTMWPNPQDEKSTNTQLWEAYAKDLWSEKFILIETLMNIREGEIFAKAHGFDFVVSCAFDQRVHKEYFYEHLGKEHSELIESLPWDKFLYPKECKSFMELLLNYDGHPELANGNFYEYYSKLKYPTEYITNCMHPTQTGYAVMAEEIYEFCKLKGYIHD